MDYSQLHDAQINMMVCKALGHELSSYARIIMQDDATILLSDNKTLVDYCNNPADAWPIITEHKISIYAAILGDSRGEWGAEASFTEHYHFHNKPLRAAMVVFLMMQEQANA